MRKSSITAIVLEDLLSGKTLTASDKHFSNTNQYFKGIKKRGIELIEVWKPNKDNRGRHLERRLNPSIENIKRAERVLEDLKRYSV